MGSVQTRTRTGTYGGRSAEARQAERHERLVAAAGDIWGEQGWAAVTMRGVCARAGLTDRYFYESFTDRDALLLAVWDQGRDHLVALVLDAFATEIEQDIIAQLRAAIAAIVAHLQRNPGHARIILGDNAGSAALEQRRRDTLQTFTDLLVDYAGPLLAPSTDENALRMSTLIGVGGFAELVTAWNTGTITADAGQIIDHVTDVAGSLVGRYLTPTT